MGTKYELRKPPAQVEISQERISQVAAEVGTYPVLVYALLNRGFSEKQIRDIMTSEFPGDALMKTPLVEADSAADRIIKALKNNERIGIFADYDCDGITSGFVMSWGLYAIKSALKSHSYIHLHYPQREDGYGLSSAFCESMKDKLDLVITVDNGIATREQEEVLDSYGIDLIVTDHHEPNLKTIPMLTKTAIVDPCYNNTGRSYLAGVAVAYNVVLTAARKVGISLNRGIFLPAVMLGTISDCMPMSYENACYIKAGLEFLNNNDKYAKFYLDAFYDSYNKKVKLPPVITPKDISFTIAPKVNSASRMGDTNLAAKALCFGIQNKKETLDLAKALTELNDKRKDETKEISDSVVSKLKLEDGQRLVTYDGSSYSKGLLGIIASKITNRFPDYPAYVYSEKDGVLDGSVRCDNEAIDCMDMFRQLKTEGIIEMCAGHSSACVVKLKKENLPAFVSKFSELYDFMDIPEVVKAVDACTSLSALTNDFLDKVSEIPFTTQEMPTFVIPNVFINRTKAMGKQKQHIELTLADNTAVKKVNWWNMAQHYEDIGSPKQVHLVCSVQQDFRSDKPCATIDIIDMVPVKQEKEDAHAA